MRRRRIRLSIPDGILNDYLKDMTNERAAYEILRLATNNLHGFSDAQALSAEINTSETPSVSRYTTSDVSNKDKKQLNGKEAGEEVSFADDLKMLS